MTEHSIQAGHIAPLADKKRYATATSCINVEHGTPFLYINHERQVPLAYLTYLTNHNRYDDFAAAGYRLFSLPVFFGFNHLNQSSGLDVFTPGIFDGQTPDFSRFDKDIESILQACPDAYILPRVNVSPSRTWELAHPDELCDPLSDGTPGRVSFASDAWAEKVKTELSAMIAHVSENRYAGHIAGYQIAGGNTEEWLPLDARGISGPRAKEKYAHYLHLHSLQDTDTAFYRFYSELVCARICEFAAFVKEQTNRSVIVGSFYGYTNECPDRTSGHHALRMLLECEDVDFLCSPISYSMTRSVGRDHPYMTPFASIRHHGKLYFSENDTRTHLSVPVNHTPWYTAPIWYGPDKQTSVNVIKLHAARALINRHAAWWFDMWGGWFSDPTYMELMQRIRELFEQSRSLPMASAAEVAVFVDEEAYAFLQDTSVSIPVCYLIRETLGTMGAPYDLYLCSDAEDVMGRYKAIISLRPATSPLGDRLAALAYNTGKPYLEIRHENADITAAELRSFLRKAGVFLWCTHDAVIYANQSYVLLHAVKDGTCVLNVPGSMDLLDVFTNQKHPVQIDCKKGESYLFRLVT